MTVEANLRHAVCHSGAPFRIVHASSELNEEALLGECDEVGGRVSVVPCLPNRPTLPYERAPHDDWPPRTWHESRKGTSAGGRRREVEEGETEHGAAPSLARLVKPFPRPPRGAAAAHHTPRRLDRAAPRRLASPASPPLSSLPTAPDTLSRRRQSPLGAQRTPPPRRFLLLPAPPSASSGQAIVPPPSPSARVR